MQIACPACNARYDIPDERLAPGKRVRCARCAESWAPIAPVSEPEPELVAMVEPSPAPVAAAAPLASAPPPRTTSRFLWIGWTATIIVLLAVLLAVLHFKPSIEHIWPPSERLYRLFT